MVSIKKRLDNDDHYDYNNPIYIVVHDTGNYTDSASGNANYFCTGERLASANYFVDDIEIYQVVEDNNGAYHCGDGYGKYGITNTNSIGIELCRVCGKVTDKTKENAIDLIKLLQDKYNIPNDKVVRHYDASRKNCPSSMSADGWKEWNEFKLKLERGVIVEEYKSRTGYLNVKPFMNTWSVFKDDKYWETWNRLVLLGCKDGLSLKILENPRYAVYKVESAYGTGWCYAEDNGNTTVTSAPVYKVSEKAKDPLYKMTVDGKQVADQCLGKWMSGFVEDNLKSGAKEIIIKKVN